MMTHVLQSDITLLQMHQMWYKVILPQLPSLQVPFFIRVDDMLRGQCNKDADYRYVRFRE